MSRSDMYELLTLKLETQTVQDLRKLLRDWDEIPGLYGDGPSAHLRELLAKACEEPLKDARTASQLRRAGANDYIYVDVWLYRRGGAVAALENQVRAQKGSKAPLLAKREHMECAMEAQYELMKAFMIAMAFRLGIIN